MIAKPPAKFEEIPPEILRQIATVSVRMPRLYFYPIRFVRKFFWARLKAIHRSMLKTVPQRRVAIDFGCGSGVFLPTLANTFDLVQGIDIEAHEAKEIVNAYKLQNVRLINADIYNLNDARDRKSGRHRSCRRARAFQGIGRAHPPLVRMAQGRWLLIHVRSERELPYALGPHPGPHRKALGSLPYRLRGRTVSGAARLSKNLIVLSRLPRHADVHLIGLEKNCRLGRPRKKS